MKARGPETQLQSGSQHWTSFPGPECVSLRCLGSSLEEWLPQPSAWDNPSLVYRTRYRTAGGKDAFFLVTFHPANHSHPVPPATGPVGLLWLTPGDVFHKWTREAAFLSPAQASPASHPSSTPTAESWLGKDSNDQQHCLKKQNTLIRQLQAPQTTGYCYSMGLSSHNLVIAKACE